MNTFKQHCIELRKKDHTIGEIVKITGRSKSSVYQHIRSIPLSQKKLARIAVQSAVQARSIASLRKGKSLRPYNVFLQWNSDLVMLCAHLLFDGEMSRTSCIYHNRSDTLHERFVAAMRSVYEEKPKTYINPVTGVRRSSYHNVALAAYLRSRAEELRQCIPDMPIAYQREFLRAFFDDEGCMDYRPLKNRRSVRGYQKDRGVLEIVKLLLTNFKIVGVVSGTNEISITGKQNLVNFQKEINFSKGICLNPKRKNSIWGKPIEKRVLLNDAISSYKSK